MKFEIPDDWVNELQRATILRLIDRLKNAHHSDVVIQSRIDGQDHAFEADWLKHLKLVS